MCVCVGGLTHMLWWLWDAQRTVCGVGSLLPPLRRFWNGNSGPWEVGYLDTDTNREDGHKASKAETDKEHGLIDLDNWPPAYQTEKTHCCGLKPFRLGYFVNDTLGKKEKLKDVKITLFIPQIKTHAENTSFLDLKK